MTNDDAHLATVANGNYFGFPYTSDPTGWFQVAWSIDVEPGTLVSLHYFGQDLVCYRGVSGEVGVLDAYCPHMGGHLGVGAPGSQHEHGCVVGDDVQCPFHGWIWNREGMNVAIPYSTQPNRDVRIRSWAVREVGGIILVWHDARQRSPMWDPPTVSELDDDGWFRLDRHGAKHRYESVRARPQYVLENIVDIGHLRYVHNHATHGRDATARADGSILRASFGCTYTTAQGDTKGRLDEEAWGVGILVLRLRGIRDNLMFIASTPVDDDHSDIFVSTICIREAGEHEPGHLAERIMHQQQQEVLNDLPLFTHQQYVNRAPFAPEERPGFVTLREWSRQFYPDNDIAVTDGLFADHHESDHR